MMVFALSCFLSTTTGKCIVEWTLLWFEHNCDPLNRDCSEKCWTHCGEGKLAKIGLVGQRHILKMIIQLLLVCGTMHCNGHRDNDESAGLGFDAE